MSWRDLDSAIVTCVFALACLALLPSTCALDVRTVGNAVRDGALYTAPHLGGKASIIVSEFPVNSILFGFVLQVQDVNPIHLQVWRPPWRWQSNTTFHLVYDFLFYPARHDVGARTMLTLGTSGCFRIQMGDRLGFTTEDVKGTLGYHFVDYGTSILHPIGQNTANPVLGSWQIFDQLSFPYKFALDAYIDTDVWTYSYSGPITNCPDEIPEDPIMM